MWTVREIIICLKHRASKDLRIGSQFRRNSRNIVCLELYNHRNEVSAMSYLLFDLSTKRLRPATNYYDDTSHGSADRSTSKGAATVVSQPDESRVISPEYR